MKALLLNVPLRPGSKQVYPPIGLAHIATAIQKSNHAVEILDLELTMMSASEVAREVKKLNPDVVAMGCIVTGYRYIKDLCRAIKDVTKAPIVVGNTVASSVPEILLKKTEADIVVFAEGDETIVDLLDVLEAGDSLSNVAGIAYLEKGEYVQSIERPLIDDLNEIPFIDWSLWDLDTYLHRSREVVSEPYPMARDKIRAMPINTARGCPFRCSFCYHAFWDKKYRVRSPERIAEEIKALKDNYGVNYILFGDELTFFSKKQCAHFATTILDAELNMPWTAVCRSDLFTVGDEELVALLKEAGCIGLGYSLESANEKILQAMNKRLSPNTFAEQTKVLSEGGLSCWTSLVIGHPLETPDTIAETFELCRQSGIYPSTGYLLPFPGAPIYEDAKEMGLIGDEEDYLLSLGDRQELHLNLTALSDEELVGKTLEECRKTANALGIDLPEKKLIKTGYYRSKKKTQ